MIHALVAEGGYQAFKLGSTEKLTGLLAALVASDRRSPVGITVGLILMRGVLAADHRNRPP